MNTLYHSNLKKLIEMLQLYAQDNFPSDKVTQLLHAITLTAADLAPFTFYSNVRYTRNQIYKEQSFELILMCWQPRQKSSIHGHEGQKCWMKVIDGQLNFTDYALQKNSLEITHEITGEAGFVDGPAYIHAVANNSTQEALSLHLYARPFNQCDIYDPQCNDTKKIHLAYHSIKGVLVGDIKE